MPGASGGPSGQQKTAVVTGANGGIGKAIASGLAKAGFEVTLVVRNAERGRRAVEDMTRAAPRANIDMLLIDLSSQRSIREGAAAFLRGHDRLDVLVNCAGVFLRERQETEDGIERTFATNYLAYYLLTMQLLPALKRAAPSRVVNVASRYGGTKIHFDDLMIKARKYSTFRATALMMVARVLLRGRVPLEFRPGPSGFAIQPPQVLEEEFLGRVGVEEIIQELIVADAPNLVASQPAQSLGADGERCVLARLGSH